jgi:type III secretion protein R
VSVEGASASVLWGLGLLAVPLLLLATTSFMKLSIVLSLLRNALGTGQVPSGMVVTVLALILTWFVMLPVQREVAALASPRLATVDFGAPLSGASRVAVGEIFDQGREPLRKFLDRNAGKAERAFFADLARRGRPEAERAEVGPTDFEVVLPAFFFTELAEALQIAFLLLLPFLVVDLVVTSILTSLGMQALSAAAVSMPFKLLLFVSVDGLRTLSEALLAGYT